MSFDFVSLFIQLFFLSTKVMRVFFPEFGKSTLKYFRDSPKLRIIDTQEELGDKKKSLSKKTKENNAQKQGKHGKQVSKHENTNARRILFVLAHPDDESMFYMPTIQNLLKEGCKLHFLFLTIGNFGDMGSIRTPELESALRTMGVLSSKNKGFGKEKLHVVSNVEEIAKGQTCVAVHREEWFRDTMDSKISWNRDIGVQFVNQAATLWGIDHVLTFDAQGVSSHPNHIECYRIVKKWKQSDIGSRIPCFTLDSVSIFRKYIAFYDILLEQMFIEIFDAKNSISEVVNETNTSNNNNNGFYMHPDKLHFLGNSISQIVDVMQCHKSQWVWFRKLFVFFSRYSYLNTWRRLD